MRDSRRFVIGLSVAGVLVAGIGAFLFDAGPLDSLTRQLGSSLLQLGLIGVGGAVIGWFIDGQRDQARKADERHRARLDIFARVRAAHIRVANAQQLINAHDTPKTYFERCRDLMLLRLELDDVATDLEVSVDLFSGSATIIKGLRDMIDYLGPVAEEYTIHKATIDSEYARQNRSLSEAITTLSLDQVDALRGSSGPYATLYQPGLTAAQGAIRRELLGGLPASAA